VKPIELFELAYRKFNGLKDTNPELHSRMVLQNQRDLMSRKMPHYGIWRIMRAISLVHCFDIYKLLNVKMELSDCVGETFYSGIPICTEEELEFARQFADIDITPDWFCDEMLGNDGKYHKKEDLPWHYKGGKNES